MDEVWEALVHPGQKLKEGARLRFDGRGLTLHGEVRERMFFGRRLVTSVDGRRRVDSIRRGRHRACAAAAVHQARR